MRRSLLVVAHRGGRVRPRQDETGRWPTPMGNRICPHTHINGQSPRHRKHAADPAAANCSVYSGTPRSDSQAATSIFFSAQQQHKMIPSPTSPRQQTRQPVAFSHIHIVLLLCVDAVLVLCVHGLALFLDLGVACSFVVWALATHILEWMIVLVDCPFWFQDSVNDARPPGHHVKGTCA